MTILCENKVIIISALDMKLKRHIIAIRCLKSNLLSDLFLRMRYFLIVVSIGVVMSFMFIYCSIFHLHYIISQ